MRRDRRHHLRPAEPEHIRVDVRPLAREPRQHLLDHRGIMTNIGDRRRLAVPKLLRQHPANHRVRAHRPQERQPSPQPHDIRRVAVEHTLEVEGRVAARGNLRALRVQPLDRQQRQRLGQRPHPIALWAGVRLLLDLGLAVVAAPAVVVAAELVVTVPAVVVSIAVILIVILA